MPLRSELITLLMNAQVSAWNHANPSGTASTSLLSMVDSILSYPSNPLTARFQAM